MKKKRTGWIILIVLVLAAAGYFVLRNQQQKAAEVQSWEIEEAHLGNLTDIVNGTGTLISRQSTTLFWQTSGIIEAIQVSEGDLISKDMELANLETSSLSQNIIAAEANLISLQQQLDALYDNKEINLTQAELKVLQLKDDLEELQEDEVWMDQPRCSQDSIDMLRDEYEYQQERVDDLEAKFDSPMWRPYVKDMIPPARRARDTAYANYSYCTEEREQSEIDEFYSRVNKTEKDLELARQQLADLQENNPSLESVASLEASISAIESVLGLQTLEAPFGGVVTHVDMQIGDQVNQGTNALRIDDLSQLLIEVQISEVDINQLEIGQHADLAFDSIMSKMYQGTINKIAPVGTPVGDDVEFTVTINLNDPDEYIKPGMTALVNIEVSEHQNAVLVSNQAIRFVDDERVVYVQTSDGSLEKIPVELGISANTYSQIISGNIQEGDKIVLNPPLPSAMEVMMGFE